MYRRQGSLIHTAKDNATGRPSRTRQWITRDRAEIIGTHEFLQRSTRTLKLTFLGSNIE